MEVSFLPVSVSLVTPYPPLCLCFFLHLSFPMFVSLTFSNLTKSATHVVQSLSGDVSQENSLLTVLTLLTDSSSAFAKYCQGDTGALKQFSYPVPALTPQVALP